MIKLEVNLKVTFSIGVDPFNLNMKNQELGNRMHVFEAEITKNT